MGAHIVNGEFQSDKYPTCPPGKVPLSVKDPMAQDLLYQYAQRRRAVDAEFADDLKEALRAAGFDPVESPVILPNGFVQGGPEDQATWWTCEHCKFCGPFVGTDDKGHHACLSACGGVKPNPNCTFLEK